MGFYECIYDCGDGDFCVDCSSSLDGFASPPTMMYTCKKHRLLGGAKFDYNITQFLDTFSTMHPKDRTTVPVELVDIKQTPVRGGSLAVAQFLVSSDDVDVSKLDDRKKLFFSVFDDAPSWDVLADGRVRLTLLFADHYVRRGSAYHNKDVRWNWRTNQLDGRDAPASLAARKASAGAAGKAADPDACYFA